MNRKQKLLSIANEYPDIVKPWISDDYVVWLKSVNDESITLDCVYGKRPYKVSWISSTDRKVKGEYKVITVHRSRSFKHVNNAIEFIREF